MKKMFFVLFLSSILFGQSASMQIVPFYKSKFFSNSKVFDKDTLRIFALMVQFQEDKDDATTGNGRFGALYSKDYGNEIIDPYPHDKNYFESKLLFARNYFYKNSKGKLFIDYKVFDSVITVSKIMRDYSSPPKVDDLKPTANFAQEVFQIFDSLYSSYDLSNYDMFIIFHAGVGRDIIIQGQINIERNIPSVFFNEKSLKNFFGENFQGFRAGNRFIKNIAILPVTENREISTLSGKVLLEITNNGLICAMIGSFLGLPDLYNTETGTTTIGRFGLMDVQSIFSYNGAIPPNLSAWEKVFLGWARPYEIRDTGFYKVKSHLNPAFEPEILKLKITDDEYYLIECRVRDYYNDNCSVVFRLGQTEAVLRNLTDEEIKSYDISKLRGVIVDIDEFDFALPGEGILIWKINERVIRERISHNKINVDKNNKGVMLIEADGIFDIGEKFRTIFGEEVFGEGTKEDFWHKNNKAIFYRNIFNDDFRPYARLSSGARSFIELRDFSQISSLMSFKFLKKQNFVKTLFEDSLFAAVSNFKAFPVFEENQIYIFNDRNLYALNLQNKSLEIVFENFSSNYPAYLKAIKSSAEEIYIVGSYNDTLNLLRQIKNGNIYTYKYKIQIPETLSSPITASFARDTLTINCAFSSGFYLEYIFVENEGIKLKNSRKIFDNQKINYILFFNDLKLYISDYIIKDDDEKIKAFDLKIKDVAAFNINNVFYICVFFEDNTFKIYRSNSIDIENIQMIYRGAIQANKLFVDIDWQGEAFFLKPEENILYGFNAFGTFKNNFPLKIAYGKFYNLFLKTSIFASFALRQKNSGKENSSENLNSSILKTSNKLFAFSDDGSIYLYDLNNGELENGYPIAGVANLKDAYLVKNLNNNNLILCLASSNGKLKINELLNTENYIVEIPGQTQLSNEKQKVFILQKDYQEILSKNRTYNWPNPVYDGKTFFRVYVEEESEIKISIYDAAGEHADEFSFKAPANFDYEIERDVSKLKRGIYFVKVYARSYSGKTSSKIIKMAIAN